MVPVDVTISIGGSTTTFQSFIQYFFPPTVQSVSVTEISTLNRALLPVTVALKNFPSVANILFSISAFPYEVLIDSSDRFTYDSKDGPVITFFAPIGPPSGRLKFEVACTDTSRFAPSVLEHLVAQFHVTYQAPSPIILSVSPSSFDISGGAQITVTAQYLRVATSSQIVCFIGSRLARNVSVLYSDSDTTRFTANVPPSDAPGIAQISVSHSLDSRVASFSIRYTGRQTATCVRNCVASASEGSTDPALISLRFFPLITRSTQLRCSVLSLSSCSLELVNSSSTTTFIMIRVGPLRASAPFQEGAHLSTVTVASNDDSASFAFTYLRFPTVLSAEFLTENSIRVVFDQNIVIQGALNTACDVFENQLSLFGPGSVCEVSRNTMTVNGGSSFPLLPGSILSVVPGLIYGREQV
jgi:hypothetical protein